MTLKELKKSGNIIFECISGSRAYNLATPTSDTDIRGVFILPKEKFYSLEYVGQINNETNDVVYYELRKFIELCSKNNPNILELLNIPEYCVLYKHPIFDEIKSDLFLSKLCQNTFANYAFTQIKKARGLKKKISNPIAKKRKEVIDFCYVYHENKSVNLRDFIEKENLHLKYFGLAKIPHIKNSYNLFYNKTLDYKGVARENANEVCLSSIPKGEKPLGLMYFNLEAYSTYCKEYREYWSWVEKRNEARYQNNLSHNKNYDAKNMMHTFRLLLMAREIGETRAINVERTDREFLLSIKDGEFEYDELVSKAEKLKDELSGIYEKSDLQEKPILAKVNGLLTSIRDKFYSN